MNPSFGRDDAVPLSPTGLVAIAILLTGCAANPRSEYQEAEESLCAGVIGPLWAYLPQPPQGSRVLESSLPSTPYWTNDGRLVSSVHRLWYERVDGLKVCTLAAQATDNCSVQVTQFARSGDGWVKVGEDAVLCHIAL